VKILWARFSFMTSEAWVASLENIKGHEISTLIYDHFVPPDRALLDSVDAYRPDLVLYTGMADWERTPSPSTFRRIRKQAKIIHLSGDLSDPPYRPYLDRYAAEDCFDLNVNLDGNRSWERSPMDLTTISPTSPAHYRCRNERPLVERPVAFGFAGGFASPSRAAFIHRWQAECGLVIPPRDERYGSYQAYADFLLDCRLIPNVPFSGSDNSRQVKGRVVETGLARACLLDHVESAARDWFTPGSTTGNTRTRMMPSSRRNGCWLIP
jgi:hypothetical protein